MYLMEKRISNDVHSESKLILSDAHIHNQEAADQRKAGDTLQKQELEF